MTEVELSTKLGIVFEPERNFVAKESAEKLLEEIVTLQVTFAVAAEQRHSIGTGPVNRDLWLEFLPWHSMN